MATISDTRLGQVIDRFEEVEARMGAATEPSEIIALSKEHAELKPVVDKARELIAARKGLVEAESLVSSGDKEMEQAGKDLQEAGDQMNRLAPPAHPVGDGGGGMRVVTAVRPQRPAFG